MAKHKYQKGHPKLGGRKKGTPNKFTTVKQAFMDFMEQEGGVKFIRKVAKDSEGRRCVLNNIAKLLPNKTELSGPDGAPLKLNVNVTINAVKAKEVK